MSKILNFQAKQKDSCPECKGTEIKWYGADTSICTKCGHVAKDEDFEKPRGGSDASFSSTMEKNARNAERIRKEREDKNRSVLRSYRIKN